jgi:hypothetical protein
MQLYAKTEEAIQSVLAKLAEDYVASMVGAGATLVQVISEPTKPLSKLVLLHNVLEHSEGPPNQPMREVYAKVAAEIDEGSGAFKTALDNEMASFEALAGR